MFRALLLSAALLGVSAPAFAGHPDEDAKPKTAQTLPQLPSEADMEDIMTNMPDLNALMGGMMEMMSDPKIQGTMKRAGEKLERKMESSGAMTPQANGLPDMNAAMGVMLSLMSDKEMVSDMMDMAGDLAETMEKQVPAPKIAP